MKHGIHIHPEWYPELTASSSFEEFQLHLHQGRYESCPEPCFEAGEALLHLHSQGQR